MFISVASLVAEEAVVELLRPPQTLLRWHHELIKRKWTYGKGGKPGRPPLDPSVVAEVVRLAKENPLWGYVRIHGELRKSGKRFCGTLGAHRSNRMSGLDSDS